MPPHPMTIALGIPKSHERAAVRRWIQVGVESKSFRFFGFRFRIAPHALECDAQVVVVDPGVGLELDGFTVSGGRRVELTAVEAYRSKAVDDVSRAGSKRERPLDSL